MKGSQAVIDMLNDRLAAEHAGIVQYVTHSAMCENWGYEKLAKYILNRAKEEMKHAGMVLDRILFLEGVPTLINVGVIEIAEDVTQMFTFDQMQEMSAIAGYTEAIEIAVEYKDFATRKLMELILDDENEHENIIESNLSQISQMGIQNYLPVNIEV
jgi:bacterioferritin